MVSILVHFQGLCFACLVYEIDSVFLPSTNTLKSRSMFGVQIQRLLNRWVSLREDPYGLLNFTTKNVLSWRYIQRNQNRSSYMRFSLWSLWKYKVGLDCFIPGCVNLDPSRKCLDVHSSSCNSWLKFKHRDMLLIN